MAISNLYPSEGPTLNLNFAGSRTLDRRITFTRTTGGTYMGRDGLIKYAVADEPRFDHRYVDGQVESLGLLIEEGSTNLVNYSTYFASGSAPRWVNMYPATATISTGIDAPDGTNTAVRLTCNNSGNSLLRVEFDGFTPNGTDTYTASFYVRKVSGTTAAGNVLACDLHDGVQKNYLPELVTNQWVRVVVTGVPSNSLKTFFDVLSDKTNNYVLDFWGLQIEQKAFATSYIPTSGSQGIRGVDNAKIDGTAFSSFYNQTEGTIYCSFRNNTTDFTNRRNVYAIQGNSVGIEIRSPNIDYNRLRFVYNGLVNDNPTQFSSTLNQRKTAFAYNTTSHQAYIDAQSVNPSTGANVFDETKNSLFIGNRTAASNDYLNGTIFQLTYYPTRLSNTQLQNLTK